MSWDPLALAFSWCWHCSQWVWLCYFSPSISSPSQVIMGWLIVNLGCCGDYFRTREFSGWHSDWKGNERITGFFCLLWIQLCYLKSCIFPLFFWLLQVLFHLLDRVRESSTTADKEKIESGGGNILIHHSRDTAEKQWAETWVLTLAGVARIFNTRRYLLQPLGKICSC